MMNKFMNQIIKLLLIGFLLVGVGYYTLKMYTTDQVLSNTSPQRIPRIVHSQIESDHSSNKNRVISDDYGIVPRIPRIVQSQIESYRSFNKNRVLSDDFGIVPSMTQKELRENFYISEPNYEDNMNPTYYKVKGASFRQFDTYILAAELGRRYGCKYFIDLGCGAATKTASLQDEFQAIAVDYGTNVARGREKYPKIQFYELDLSKKDCSLGIPEAILRDAVVVNADVIEHIPDPYACILPLLANLTKYAKAVVVSTPDSIRHRGYRGKGKGGKVKPKNTYHVREWTLQEFEAMLSDYNLVPMISGWGCAVESCKSYSEHITIIMALASVPAIEAWAQELNTEITAFILVHSKTTPSLYNQVIKYYSDQSIETIVFTKEILEEGHSAKQVIIIKNLNDMILEIKRKYTKSAKNHWFMFVDGHEIIQPPSQRIRKWNLADSIRAVDSEPFGFNAIPMTILFSALEKNAPIRFKWYVDSVWHSTVSLSLKPSFDTLRNRIRIWRNSVGEVSLVVAKTTIGETIQDVTFTERQVYPYNYVSIRYHPEKVKSVFNLFDEGIQKTCVVDAALSYINRKKKKVPTATLR